MSEPLEDFGREWVVEENNYVNPYISQHSWGQLWREISDDRQLQYKENQLAQK